MIDIKTLDRFLLYKVQEEFLRLQEEGRFANLDRDVKQLEVTRMWCYAVLSVLGDTSDLKKLSEDSGSSSYNAK